MLVIYDLLSACLGAFIGKLMALAVHFLPQILLEEPKDAESEKKTREPREIFSRFFQDPQCWYCEQPISWWQNAPIIGYFLTKGQCPSCNKALGKQRILLETGMAILFAITAAASHSEAQFFFIAAISSLLICCFITDLEHGILPDQFTLSLLWVGLIGSTFNLFISPTEAIIGAVSGYGIFWLMNELYRWYRHQDGMFPGDFKLNAALGACLGIFQLIPLLAIALVLVMLTTIIKYFTQNKPALSTFVKQEISYGCYLAVVALITIYLKLFGIIN